MAKVWDCIQGTSKWTELRAGRPCSSSFDKIITPGGKPSKSASDYCNYLIVETILGRPLGTPEMPGMTRGKDLESEAIAYYELLNDVETIPVGFVTTDDERIGASPDRFVGENGNLEVKAPLVETQTKYLSSHINFLIGEEDGFGVQDDYRCQLQGQLFVTERDYTDIVAYFPGLPHAIRRVARDEEFILKMKSLLYQFLDLFDERLEKLMQLGYITEPQKRAAEEPVTAFGLTEADVEDYISAMKEKGVWSETPTGDAAASGGAAASEAATDPSGEGNSPQQSLFNASAPEPAYAGDPNDGRRKGVRRR